MFQFFLLFAFLYLLVSLWAHSFKKHLKNKDAWFIKSAWKFGGWVWPISWRGHTFFIIICIVLYLCVYVFQSNPELHKFEYLLPWLALIIGFASWLFALHHSESHQFENDKWFDWLINKINPPGKVYRRDEFPMNKE